MAKDKTKDFFPVGTLIIPIGSGYLQGVFKVIPFSEAESRGTTHWPGAKKVPWIKCLRTGNTYWSSSDKSAYIELTHPLEILIYGL